MKRNTISLFGITLFMLTWAGPAHAQRRIDYNWLVEIHTGGAFGTTPTTGTGRLPEEAAGSTFTFGEGARQFKQFNPLPSSNITPLDPTLTRAMSRQRAGGSFGLRLTRVLNARVTIEGSFTVGYRPGKLVRGVLDELETTRNSYATALEILFRERAAMFAAPQVNIATDVIDRRGYEVIGVGALNVRLADGPLQPYVTVGVGMYTGLGDFPSFRLEADYQFLFNGSPVRQRDRLIVRQHVGKGPLAVVGGGVRRAITDRVGLCADVRLYVGGSVLSTRVEATSSTASNVPVALITPTPDGLAFVPVLNGSVVGTSFKTSGARVLSTVTVGFFIRM